LTLPLYLLDTDTCIFLMRSEHPTLAAHAQSIPIQQQVMSAVTFAELTSGVQASASAKRKQNQAVLDSLALNLGVLDWPQEAAQHYAEIRFDLKKRGAQLGATDFMIAAHALTLGATVITTNIKDFGRVKGLKVESWAE
jgi:tRNA(fMet)-specific endonuclease VapC